MPPEILLIPAFLILAIEGSYQSWRWLVVTLRRPRVRRVLVTVLFALIAASNAVTAVWHFEEVASRQEREELLPADAKKPFVPMA